MGQPGFDLLNRWGWGIRWQNLPGRDVLKMDHLKWYQSSDTDSERIFELWNYMNGNTLLIGHVYVDKRSGLISRHIGYYPDGTLHHDTICEFAEIADSVDPTRVHWAPVALHESAWRNGRLARSLSVRVREMQINVDFDCDAARERLFAFFPPKADLFERHSDGKVRVMLLVNGQWIDQDIPELSGGRAAVDPATLPPAPPGLIPGSAEESLAAQPSNDRQRSPLTWVLIGAGALLLMLAVWLFLQLPNRRQQ
jgi:hypothetical protein